MPASKSPVQSPVPWSPSVELDGGTRDCGSGLLLSLVIAMRSISEGQLLLLRTREKSVLADLPAWARLAGHELLSVSVDEGAPDSWSLVIMRGRPRRSDEHAFTGGSAAPLGSRLWLYTNFHCNLSCDYCCARSSPATPARLFPHAVAEAAIDEFVAQGGRELMITGGEPFLHPELGAIVSYGSQRVPTVILTNAMVFDRGRRLETLRSMDRGSVTLQISLDSAGPTLHDRQRGAGSHAKALAGIGLARELGFGVRVAATLSEDDLSSADRLHAALDNLGVDPADRLIRPIAAEGYAEAGVHLSLSNLEPEPTLTVDGAWWHPVSVTNPNLKVADAPLPLSRVLDVMRDVLEVHAAGATEGREVFRCV